MRQFALCKPILSLLPAYTFKFIFIYIRFPLRSKELCAHSKISNIPVTLDTISDLMKKFRQEMFDVLLFVNNLEEISLSDITRTGKSVSCHPIYKCT